MKTQRKHFGLDLDETLISATGTAVNCQISAFDNGFDFTIDDLIYENGKPLNYYYYISERPHLHDFLSYLEENYNVFIYSRAESSYVHKISSRLGFDSNKTPIFTRDDCDIIINDEKTIYKKNLNKISEKLGVNVSDIIFLDDITDAEQITQIAGLIKAPEYIVNESDDYLKNLINDIKNGAN